MLPHTKSGVNGLLSNGCCYTVCCCATRWLRWAPRSRTSISHSTRLLTMAPGWRMRALSICITKWPHILIGLPVRLLRKCCQGKPSVQRIFIIRNCGRKRQRDGLCGGTIKSDKVFFMASTCSTSLWWKVFSRLINAALAEYAIHNLILERQNALKRLLSSLIIIVNLPTL